MTLTKKQAAAMFGTSAAMARAMGINKQAIYQWSEELTQRQTDEIVGLALRLGKQLPAGFIASIEQAAA